eukprot:Awhi_evm1s1761
MKMKQRNYVLATIVIVFVFIFLNFLNTSLVLKSLKVDVTDDRDENSVIELSSRESVGSDIEIGIKSRTDPHSIMLDNFCSISKWQEKYAKLHRVILAQPHEQKLLVAKNFNRNGMSDRVTSLATLFMIALLTDRAFVIDWIDPESFTKAFHSPWLGDALVVNRTHIDEYEFTMKDPFEKIEGTGFVGAGHPSGAVFENDNFNSKVYEEKKKLVLHTNHGNIIRLFENPYYRQRLIYEFGLTPEIAPACILDFLFRPNGEVVNRFPKTLQQLQSTDYLTIGVQVRIGDVSFSPSTETKENNDFSFVFGSFFKCAEDLEKALGDQQVKFFLITDNREFKQIAKEKYKEKLIITDTLDMGHTSNKNQDALISSAAEQYLFSLPSYKIISSFSGFGRLGAARSILVNNLYTLDVNPNKPKIDFECTLQNFDILKKMSTDFTGI